MPDGCWVVVFVLFVIPALARAFKRWEEEQAAEAVRRAEAEAKAADEKFLRENPEAWLAKQKAQLERERLEAEKHHASEESNRRNASTLASIVGGLFGK